MHGNVVKVDDDKLSMIEAVSQAVIFFAAGQETTSSVICCCLYELAKNPDIQEKVQANIDEIANRSEGLTYTNLFQIRYLDLAFWGKIILNNF